MTLTILLDIDGVLADFCTAYLAVLNRQTGRRHVPADVTTWQFHDSVASKLEDHNVWAEAGRRGFCRDLAAYPGADDFLARLRIYGRVVAVTAPASTAYWASERTDWLRCRGFATKDIVLAHDKTLVQGDILIDDSAANVRAYAQAHPDREVALLDRPWNQAEPGSWVNSVRCLGYREVLERVSRLARRVV